MGYCFFNKTSEDDDMPVTIDEFEVEYEEDGFDVEQNNNCFSSIKRCAYNALQIFSCGTFGRSKYSVESILADADKGDTGLMLVEEGSDTESSTP